MSRPPRPPDAEVLFELSSLTMEGKTKHVLSGYRPIYDIRPDYWTSTHHEFLNSEGISTGESATANVWFLTPEIYPHTLWVGRVFKVAEGSRVVGAATVLKVLNPLLMQNGS